MFVWYVKASSCSQAKREKLWKLLEDVEHWPLWDTTLEAAHLDGPFAVGSKGWVKRKLSSPLPLKITFVEKEERFGMIAKKFLTTVALTFQLHSLSDGSTCVTAQVIVGGLMAPFFRRTTAKELKKSLPVALDTLCKKA